MNTNQIQPFEDIPMLSLNEARVAGKAAHRLSGIRDVIRKGVTGVELHVRTERGVQSLMLKGNDADAVLGLLMERDEITLTGLNVEVTE